MSKLFTKDLLKQYYLARHQQWGGLGANVSISISCKDDIRLWNLITQFDNISSLNVKYQHSTVFGKWGPISDKELVNINNITNLDSIEIYLMPITGIAFKDITNLKLLRRIKFSASKSLDSLFDHIFNLPALQMLTIEASKIIHPNWDNLTKLDKFRFLVIDKCKMTDKTINKFPVLNHIETLSMDENQLSGEGMIFIKHSPKLTRFSVKKNLITLQGVKCITNAGTKNIMDLDLSENRIGDDAIKYLFRIQKLQDIDLSFTKVTESGVFQLKKMETLRYLTLKGIKISVDSAKKLQESIPKCHILLDSCKLDALEYAEDFD
jgi:hypothetical protein